MDDKILITDVAPRDGLQNEPEILPVATKIALVERLLAAGVPRVEIGSFVNPRQVPQMAGTAEVAGALLGHDDGRPTADDRRTPDLGDRDEPPVVRRPSSVVGRLTCLVPNMRGYELAVAAGMRHVRLVLAASEALNQANFKRGVDDSLADFAAIAARAAADGVGFGVAIGAAFGCPFEGHVPPARVIAIARRLAALGADEIVLADTTGMGVPTQVGALCAAIIGEGLGAPNPSPILTIHLHNTRNTGYANAYAAYLAGVRSFDASLGGIGGCPFAPRAVGNIASEDLVHMLNGMGAPTGIDLAALIAASAWLGGQMGKTLPALVGKAEPVFLGQGDKGTRGQGEAIRA